MTSLEKQLRTAFEQAGIQVEDDSTLLPEVAKMAFQRALDPSRLVDSFEAFSLNTSLDGVLRKGVLLQFGRYLGEQESAAAPKRLPGDVSAAPPPRSMPIHVPHTLSARLSSRPPDAQAHNTGSVHPTLASCSNNKRGPSMQAAASSQVTNNGPTKTLFQQRTNALQVVSLYVGSHTADAVGGPPMQGGEEARGPARGSSSSTGKVDSLVAGVKSVDWDHDQNQKPHVDSGFSSPLPATLPSQGASEGSEACFPERAQQKEEGQAAPTEREADTTMAVQEERTTESTRTNAAEEGEVVSWGSCVVEQLGRVEPQPGSRFMKDPVTSRWNELNKRFELFIEALEKADPNFKDSKLSMFASEGRVAAVGRVCCDSENGTGHLNHKSILLEGCNQSGCQGLRVRLDLSNIPEFSLFPGQIVAVEGDNPSGHILVASRIRSFLHPPALSSLGNIHPERKRYKLTGGNQPASDKDKLSARPGVIIAAAGPFTASDNWQYEPLTALLDYVEKVEPDILLLLGPFVDAEHQHVKVGLVDEDFDNLFKRKVFDLVTSRLKSASGKLQMTQVVLQPSCRDVMHDCTYPQPPLSSEALGTAVPSNISHMSNPAVFTLNSQVAVASTTVDILKHLSSEETSKAPPGQAADRMARLALHLIGQRSFYPLFPPAPGMCLDTSLAPDVVRLPVLPHLLLLPSDLAPFAKLLPLGQYAACRSGAMEPGLPDFQPMCVNPGRLTKGATGGTFAKITLFSAQEERLHEHLKVEVIRV